MPELRACRPEGPEPLLHCRALLAEQLVESEGLEAGLDRRDLLDRHKVGGALPKGPGLFAGGDRAALSVGRNELEQGVEPPEGEEFGIGLP